jgi:hypothetical protein
MMMMRQVGLLCAAATIVSAGAVRVSNQVLSFTPVGSIRGPVDQVTVLGRYAYLAADYAFTIVDVSSPGAPKAVGTYTFPEKIWAFSLRPPLAYVAADFFGLGILDIEDPTRPVLRGSVKTPGQAKGVALVGTTALLTDHMSGVDFVDVSNTAKPSSLGSFFLDGYARDVASAGSMAYAVDSPTGLYVFDLSKPFDLSKAEPFEPVAAQQSVSGSRVIDVAPARQPSGVHIAVMTGGPALQVYNVSNPRMPQKLASYLVPGGTQRAALQGNLAYVAAGAEGLQVVDLSTPAKPTIVGSYKTPAPARDVAVADSLVFVSMGKVATRYQGDGEVLILRQGP